MQTTHRQVIRIPRLQEQYRTVVVPKLAASLKEQNVMALPRLVKVVLNAGIGKFATDAKRVESIVKMFTRISGQKPVITKAKKSISNFKIRQGLGIGVTVTLRGPRMYDFLDKLIHVTLPRVRDFHGLPVTSFDSQGNYSLAIREHNVFPEIRSDELEMLHGLQITICTTAKTKPEAVQLLTNLGFPLQKEQE